MYILVAPLRRIDELSNSLSLRSLFVDLALYRGYLRHRAIIPSDDRLVVCERCVACVVGIDDPELIKKLFLQVVLIVDLCVVFADERVQLFAQLAKCAVEAIDVPFFWRVEAL